MKVWPCKRFDFDWRDWLFALRAGLAPADLGAEARLLERWLPGGSGLVCLTVRSAFDLYLRAQRWSPGDEIVFSALTIPDMPALARAHGLRPVALDVDPGTGLWDVGQLAERIGPRTRAVVLAHLFGARFDLAQALALAVRRGVAVVEDCAQAWAGPDWSGHEQADLSLFSFGPVKTATALGGALCRVRDRRLHAHMRDIAAQDARQPTGEYLRRLVVYGALQAASTPLVFGALVHAAARLGRDHATVVNALTRNVAPDRGASDGLLARLRRRPCAALVALLERRLDQGGEPLARRAAAAQALLQNLPPDARVPTAHSAGPHGYWVAPLLMDDGEALRRALRGQGFDVMFGRLAVVLDEDNACPGAERLARAPYLPFDPRMPNAELERLGRAVAAFARRPR